MEKMSNHSNSKGVLKNMTVINVVNPLISDYVPKYASTRVVRSSSFVDKVKSSKIDDTQGASGFTHSSRTVVSEDSPSLEGSPNNIESPQSSEDDVQPVREIASLLTPDQHFALEYLNMYHIFTWVNNYCKTVDLIRVQANQVCFLKTEVSNLQGNVSLLQKVCDRLARELSATTSAMIATRIWNDLLTEVFDFSDLSVASNLDREALLVQKYEHLKLEFRKLLAIVGNLRPRVRSLREVSR
ncbi:hypothetical protein C5167_040827, partial [Papaver somniferum]